MVFASLTFIYIFLPIFFIIYFLFHKDVYIQNIIICVFSLLFYAWGEPVYVFLLVFSVWINYILGKKIGENKKYFYFGIVFNILMIFIFKYTNLFIEINNLWNIKKIEFKMPLPIGISFYTFQALSYLIDVHNKKVKCQKNFFNLLLYISMFPQLIAGPIVRYRDINKAITKRSISFDKIYEGIVRTIIGISKKVILANQMSIVVDSLLLNERTICGSFCGIIFFVIQLYFDFSGYSDIAIGIGKIIGFDFLENFNYPFLSTSMTEFWRRWHISLGSFFRDYVYIPLGGNKKNQYLNIIIVWFLTGIWHGASINFVFWGIFLALSIVFEKFFSNIIYNKLNLKFVENNVLFNILGHIYFIIVLFVGFTFFYFDNVGELKIFILNFFKYEFFDYTTKSILVNNFNLIIFSIICLFPVFKNISNYVTNNIDKNISIFLLFLNMVICIVLLLFSTLLLIGGTNNPFMYFRF